MFFFFLFPEQKNLLLIWWSHSFPLLEDDRDKVLGSCCCSSRMYRNKKKRKEKSRVCGVRKEHGTPDLYRAPAKTKRPGPGKKVVCSMSTRHCVCVSLCLCVCVCNVVSCRLLLPRLALPFYLFLFSIKDQNQSIRSHRFSRRSRHSCDFCTLTFLLF